MMFRLLKTLPLVTLIALFGLASLSAQEPNLPQPDLLLDVDWYRENQIDFRGFMERRLG